MFSYRKFAVKHSFSTWESLESIWKFFVLQISSENDHVSLWETYDSSCVLSVFFEDPLNSCFHSQSMTTAKKTTIRLRSKSRGKRCEFIYWHSLVCISLSFVPYWIGARTGLLIDLLKLQQYHRKYHHNCFQTQQPKNTWQIIHFFLLFADWFFHCKLQVQYFTLQLT